MLSRSRAEIGSAFLCADPQVTQDTRADHLASSPTCFESQTARQRRRRLVALGVRLLLLIRHITRRRSGGRC